MTAKAAREVARKGNGRKAPAKVARKEAKVEINVRTAAPAGSKRKDTAIHGPEGVMLSRRQFVRSSMTHGEEDPHVVIEEYRSQETGRSRRHKVPGDDEHNTGHTSPCSRPSRSWMSS